MKAKFRTPEQSGPAILIDGNQLNSSCKVGSACVIAKRTPSGVTGKPFNIASYALLTMMIAQVCDLKLGDFVHTLGDAHIYSNHFEQVQMQLARTPGPLPIMKINPEVYDLFAFRFEDFALQGYEAQPSIAAPIAV